MKRFLLIALLLLIWPLLSQPTHDPPYAEVNLPEEVRLSSLDLLFADRRDFIWLAAGHHLYWYDGFTFNKIEVPASREGDVIRSFYQMRNGDYWVGWESGSISNIVNDSLVAYEPAEGTPAAPVIGWTESSDGQLWMCSDGEGVYVRDSTERWYHFGRDDGLPSLDAYAITAFEDGVLVATDQGVVLLSFIKRRKSSNTQISADGLPDQVVKAIGLQNDKVWLAFYNDYLYSPGRNTKNDSILLAPEENAHQLIFTGTLAWWLGESGNLYSSHKAGTWSRVSLQQHPGSKVRHMAADGEGQLWVATEDGLFILKAWLEFLDTPEPVTALCHDRDMLWYACGTDLWIYNLDSGDTRRVFSGNYPIISLFTDESGYLWMGTFDNGVQILNPATGEITVVNEEKGLINNNVLSIGGGTDGAWLGTLGGVSFVQYDSDYRYPMIENFENYRGRDLQYIYKVHVDQQQDVYLATDGDGIVRWPQNGDPEAISQKVVLDVVSDLEGRIWWISAEGSVFSWSPGGSLNEIPNVENDIGDVSGLTIAENGDILVLHENGIHRWNPQSQIWTGYDRSFGLGLLRPELHAHDMTPKGVLYVGTARGLAIVRTSLLPQSTTPATVLLDVRLFQKPTARNSFSFNENNINFTYIGRWYTDPNEVRYKVKLEGFDNDWRTTKNPEINYPRLPPGDYCFKVIAGIAGQFQDEQTQIFSFSISPPWYTRWYFIGLCILLVVSLVYGYIRTRVNRLLLRDKLEKEKVRAQYESIKSQVNPHFLFNSFNTLMALIEDDTDEAREYLQDLSDFFRHILQYREVDLISLGEELKIISTYLDLQSRRFGEGMKVQVDISESHLSAPVPPLTLQLLLENAFKHNVASRKRPLEIRIYIEKDFIVVWNRRQEKQKKEDSTGYGLEGIKKKYALFTKSRVRVEQEKDSFTVFLPMLKTVIS